MHTGFGVVPCKKTRTKSSIPIVISKNTCPKLLDILSTDAPSIEKTFANGSHWLLKES